MPRSRLERSLGRRNDPGRTGVAFERRTQRPLPGAPAGRFNDAVALALSLACVGAWLWVCFRFPRSPQKSLFAWSGGLTAFWVAIVLLWLPWFDHQRSFRAVAAAAARRRERRQLGEGHGGGGLVSGEQACGACR